MCDGYRLKLGGSIQLNKSPLSFSMAGYFIGAWLLIGAWPVLTQAFVVSGSSDFDFGLSQSLVRSYKAR